MRGERAIYPPCSKDVFLPSLRGKALAVAKRQLITELAEELMGHVEGREPVIAERIGVILDDRLAATADRAGVVERFRVGVARHETETARHALLQTHLQRIEIGESAGRIVRESSGIRSSIGCQTESQKLVKMDATCAGVHHFEKRASSQIVFEAGIPDHRVGNLIIRIYGHGIG